MAKTKEAADRIGVTTATIRHWTNPRSPYYEFVSESARGGDRTARQFTDQDIRILAAVGGLSREGMAPDDIAANLRTMQAAGWRDLPALPSLPAHDNEIPTVSADAAAIAIDKTRDILTQQIRALEGEIARLEDALHEERQERRGLQVRLEDAIGQRERLAGQLEALETGAGRERKLYTGVMIAAAALAIVLLAAVVYMAVWGGA